MTAGDRLVVEVGVWSSAAATATSVTDSAGNSYTELLHFQASDKTEMSIWTAPITAGGGTRPTITVKPSSKTDVGAVALEYAGVSSVSGTGVLDRSAFASGKTAAAGIVSSGATQPTSAANELAIGFYLDSGFGDTLGGGSGYTTRANVSPDGDIELLAQDALPAAGATPNPTFTTGAATVWLTSTVVLRPQAGGEEPPPPPGGEWSSLMSWPFEAIHLFLLSNGHVLSFDGWQQPEPTYVWNPATQEFASSTAPASIFCSGMAQLPNGEVMTVGGYGGLTTGQLGIVNAAIFNPATGTWSSAANMHTPRWYPDFTELPNGNYVAISGNSNNAITWADTPEVYDPKANTWTALSKVSTSQVHEEEYPFSYLIPNGNVFTIGPSEDVSYELNVANETWTSVGASGITNGASVMYRPGKILYSGGAPGITKTTEASANTSTIDLTEASPKWRHIAPMHNARDYHTLTMLADGTVLAVGGEQTSDQSTVTSGVLPTEIWNPTSETWTTTAPIATARNYHSTAILMPDATVLSAGGGHSDGLGGPGQFSAQIYSPAYLSAGPRPTITSAPAAATYNTSITVATPDAASISAVNLVSLGADTHQGDMAQHFVPLSFTASSGSLTVHTPANASLAPYGNYMLFLIGNKGVPSVSAPLNLSAAPEAPAAPTGVTATAAQGSATVTWTAPSPGSSPITSYTITPYIGSTAQPTSTITGAPPATSATITGLTNGTTYTFKVSATNAVGTGPASEASNAVTPSGPTAPGAPTALAATPGNASATVTWSAPAANGSPITSYTITPYIGSTAQPTSTITGAPPVTSATITGLTNGTTYTFKVSATNAIGTGPVVRSIQRGHANRHHVPGVRAAGSRPRSRRQPVGDPQREPDDRQSPGRRGWRVEQRPRDDLESAGLGRRHLHRAAAFHGNRRHGDERVERSDQLGRWNTAGDHRHAHVDRRRRRGRPRVLGAVERRGLGCGRSDGAGHGQDDHGERGLHAGDGRHDGPGRAGRRLLRGLRLRRHADGADGLQRPCQRLAGRGHGAPGRGCADGRDRRHPDHERPDGRIDDLADGDDRVQAGAGQRTARRAGRCPGTRAGVRGGRQRHGHVDCTTERRQPDHLLHRHPLRRSPTSEANDGLGHERGDHRLEERQEIPVQGRGHQRARQGTDLVAHQSGRAHGVTVAGDAAVGPLVHPALERSLGRAAPAPA